MYEITFCVDKVLFQIKPF